MKSLFKRFIADIIPTNHPLPELPKFNPGGTKENYNDVEDEQMLKRLLEEQLGKLTNKEFSAIMDRHNDEKGFYLGRDVKGAELNLLSTYLDQYRKDERYGQ